MGYIEKMKRECEKHLRNLTTADVAQQFDDVQNEVMISFFGSGYYDHVGSGDDVEDAYNKTSEIRADYILKAGEGQRRSTGTGHSIE